MEIRDILKKLRKHKRLIVLFVIIGFFFGCILNFVPPTYTSSGSLYIKRSINQETEYFTYEGYYGQQTALSYTNSVVALLESPDVKREVLKLMNLSTDERNIRKLSKMIRAKKIGPQVILVTVKSKNYDTSKEVWDKTVNSLVEVASKVNRNGDKNLGISLVSEQPIVKESFRSLYLFGTAGSLMFFTFSLFYISLKEYFKD